MPPNERLRTLVLNLIGVKSINYPIAMICSNSVMHLDWTAYEVWVCHTLRRTEWDRNALLPITLRLPILIWFEVEFNEFVAPYIFHLEIWNLHFNNHLCVKFLSYVVGHLRNWLLPLLGELNLKWWCSRWWLGSVQCTRHLYANVECSWTVKFTSFEAGRCWITAFIM